MTLSRPSLKTSSTAAASNSRRIRAIRSADPADDGGVRLGLGRRPPGANRRGEPAALDVGGRQVGQLGR